MLETESKRIAVLIDAENVPAVFADQIFEKASSMGRVVMKEMYGSGPALCSWTEPALRYVLHPNITLRQTKGKNTSDIALTIGAMDLLVADIADDVVIVSSDSDFSALSIRLRTAGKNVIGMGEQKSNAMWKVACTDFITLEQRQSQAETQLRTVEPKTSPTEPEIDIEAEALQVLRGSAGEDGFMTLSDLLAQLRRKHPHLLPGRSGFDKAIAIFRGSAGFDVRREKRPGYKSGILEIREHTETEEQIHEQPTVDVNESVRSCINRMMAEKNGRLPISSMFPELNTIPGYRELQKRSGKKPQQFIIDTFGDLFRTEDINGGLWTLPVDEENTVTEEKPAELQTDTVDTEDTEREENAVESTVKDETPQSDHADAPQSAEFAKPISETLPGEVPDLPTALESLLREHGTEPEIAGHVAQIMTGNKPFKAYNSLRKEYGNEEGGQLYNRAKALLKQL